MIASRARSFGACSGTGRPATRASSGPSIRNSKVENRARTVTGPPSREHSAPHRSTGAPPFLHRPRARSSHEREHEPVWTRLGRRPQGTTRLEATVEGSRAPSSDRRVRRRRRRMGRTRPRRRAPTRPRPRTGSPAARSCSSSQRGSAGVEIRADGASGGAGGHGRKPGHGRASVRLVRRRPRRDAVRQRGRRRRRGEWPGAGETAAGTAAAQAAVPSTGRRPRRRSGGGGATDVRRGGTGLEHRILVAGGGSGGAGGGIGGPPGTGGGDGGELTGADGLAPLGSVNPASGGKGGSSVAGGAAGRSAPQSGTATAGRSASAATAPPAE